MVDTIVEKIGQIEENLNNKVDLPINRNQKDVDYVIEWQKPTYDNGYSWYRLYKSGWLEQGGVVLVQDKTITFPRPFANTNYTIVGNEIMNSPTAEYELSIVRTSASQARIYCDSGGTFAGLGACWMAMGMANSSP